MSVNHFPQADTHTHGARFLDVTNAPLGSDGRPTWWVLDPEMVFAYLEKPPAFVANDGAGARWDWSGTGPSPLRAGFKAARAEGLAVSDAVERMTGDLALSAELRAQEAVAKAVIASGALDPWRDEWATRAGLSADDARDVRKKTLATAAVDFLRGVLSRGNPPQAQFGQMAPKPLPQTNAPRGAAVQSVSERLKKAFGPPLPLPTDPAPTAPAAPPASALAPAASPAKAVGIVVGSSAIVAGLLYLLVRRK